MTNLHRTIILALVDELQPHLPQCEVLPSLEWANRGNHYVIKVVGRGNAFPKKPGAPPPILGDICILQAEQDGITLYPSCPPHYQDQATVEYADPDMVGKLVRLIESEISSLRVLCDSPQNSTPSPGAYATTSPTISKHGTA